MADQTGTRILALLDDERAAIRRADYTALEALATNKEELFRALPASDTNDAVLADIKLRLDNNQKLFRAAINGVHEAQKRLAALRQVRDGLSVYDQSGQVSKVKQQRSEIEKKA